jgi:hypothetical protein
LLSLTPRWIPVQNLNTPLQVVQRLGVGSSVPSSPASTHCAYICQSRFLQPHKALFDRCNPCLPNSLLFQVLPLQFCMHFQITQSMPHTLSPPHRHVQFYAPCYFAPPPPGPNIAKHKSPQPFAPTSPQTVQHRTAFNTSSVGTACSSLKHSYIDNSCTKHATCFDTFVSSLDARVTATVPCTTDT